jgi:hypothetical protein
VAIGSTGVAVDPIGWVYRWIANAPVSSLLK